jgi:hypothetical protein
LELLDVLGAGRGVVVARGVVEEDCVLAHEVVDLMRLVAEGDLAPDDGIETEEQLFGLKM